jgi:Bacteriophage clamp loader A subunit
MNDNPFDFLNSINQTKVNLIRDEGRGASEYAPYLMNKGLSQFPDTIMQANVMNQRGFLDKQMQYEYLLHSIRPRKRFSKWAKKEDAELIQGICDLFGCSDKKAEEIRDILGQKLIGKLIKEREKAVGGIQNAK